MDFFRNPESYRHKNVKINYYYQYDYLHYKTLSIAIHLIKAGTMNLYELDHRVWIIYFCGNYKLSHNEQEKTKSYCKSNFGTSMHGYFGLVLIFIRIVPYNIQGNVRHIVNSTQLIIYQF